MSGLDWERDRTRATRRLSDEQARESKRTAPRTQEYAETLAEVIEEAKDAKRAGRFFTMPPGISKKDKKLIWARTFSELKGVSRR